MSPDVASAAAGEAPQFSLPECWFGVAHPGEGHKFKHAWDAAQNGVGHRLETSEVLPGRWVRGTFTPDVKRFGKNGSWHAMRVPLAELLDEQRIRERVTDPLRAKYREAFAPAAGEPSVS